MARVRRLPEKANGEQFYRSGWLYSLDEWNTRFAISLAIGNDGYRVVFNFDTGVITNGRRRREDAPCLSAAARNPKYEALVPGRHRRTKLHRRIACTSEKEKER